MSVVCNATPLVLLSKLSDFQFLKFLYQKISIPQEVYDEVVTKGKSRPGEKELKKAQGDWIEVKTPRNRDTIRALRETHGLGVGEASAIVLSQELKSTFLLTDDGPARKVASRLFHGTGTTVSGTIGVLKFARKNRMLTAEQFKSKMAALRQEGFYLKDSFYRQILREAEEEETD